MRIRKLRLRKLFQPARLEVGVRYLAASALCVWAVAVLMLVALPGSRAADLAVEGACWVTVVFAAVAFAGAYRSARRGAGGALSGFWSLLGCGLVLKFAGDASREELGALSGVGFGGVSVQDGAYVASYLLLAAALLGLVAATTRSITLVSALDAASIMLSTGLVIWHLLLEPVAGSIPSEGWRGLLVAFTQPVGNAALLYLCLVLLSSERRPAFCGLLTGGFVLFLVADGVHLRLDAAPPYEAGGLPQVVGTLGIGLFGLAALRSAVSGGLVPQLTTKPLSALSFWVSPLSPALHYGLLLAWGAFYGPPPAYVLLGGVVLMVLFALRASLVSFVDRGVFAEGERRARRSEQGRLSEELHDTVKQSVYGVSVLVDSYRQSRAGEGESQRSRELLEQVVEASEKASFQVGRPVEELRALSKRAALDPAELLGQLLPEIERYFGIQTHSSLAEGLGELSPEQLGAAYRVASEALWNAGRHSGAKNVWLESRRVGSVVLVRVRDDGRGYAPQEVREGSGQALMRQRARESGGALDLISRPRVGTTVQIRFETR